MILVDTSVWIDHFRTGIPDLENSLESFDILIHPLVIGELACGNLKNRREILELLHALPSVRQLEDNEILYFIDNHSLSGKGLGLVDIHLLASSYLEVCSLWTLDKRLYTVSGKLSRDK